MILCYRHSCFSGREVVILQDVLVVLGVQNDFICGALGTAQARVAIPNTVKKIQKFCGKVFFLREIPAGRTLCRLILEAGFLKEGASGVYLDGRFALN